jgi:hypothetical protein
MSRVNRVQGSASCEVCGNTEGQCFEVHLGGERHVFDSFECALDALTPKCAQCGCTFVGHGVQLGNTIYCGYDCASAASAREYKARVSQRQQVNF